MEKLRSAKLFLLDMDGTLYLGNEPLPGAIDFVQKIEASGKKYIYLTNNSSRAGSDYIPRLRDLGFPCGSENVFTSGMAAGITLRRDYSGKGVYAVGTEAFISELSEYGVFLTEDNPDVVIVGFDRELTYRKLELAVKYLRRGAVFLATNPDWVCPMPEDEVLPDCGSICALLTASTGREPEYIGKPNRNMVDMLAERLGLKNGEIAVVGDRLYTDIAVALNSGAVSVLVLSGETKREALEASPFKPDYVCDSVAEISKIL